MGDNEQNASPPGDAPEKFPSFDFAKLNLDYVINLNRNNESRINMYIQLNTAMIVFINVVYMSKIRHDSFWQWIATSMFGASVLLFIVSLVYVGLKAYPRISDGDSIMLTDKIASFDDYDKYKEHLFKKMSTKEFEVNAVLRELYAMSCVAKDRGRTIKTARTLFAFGVASYMAALFTAVWSNALMQTP